MEELKIIDFRTEEPTVRAGVKLLLFTVASERARGGRLIRILHKEEADNSLVLSLRRTLKQLKAKGRIVCMIAGEQFLSEQTETLYLLDKMPSLQTDASLDSGKDDFTLVFLG